MDIKQGNNQSIASALPPDTIESFLKRQLQQDTLRFITCGSVDDGKSTLIGRLLWESHQIFDDQLSALEKESKKFGTQGEEIDFALLVDGLAAEREQGITIDVAYRFFATSKRKFIVADTPGHEQYTRNMVTGASTADIAILLVDARQGLLTQTHRHSYLASLMGIRHIVLAINKMDLIGFKQVRFDEIKNAFSSFAQSFGFDSITPIPLSALKGDNITQRSAFTPWYTGPSLIEYLETIKIAPSISQKLIYPVQWVNRPNSDFRGFAGTIAQGAIKLGDEIRVIASGQTAVVNGIITMDGELENAGAGAAITITLDREIDASRGDVISLKDDPLETSDQFEASIIWMSEEPGLVGRRYEIKLSTQHASASITNIKYNINVNTLAQQASQQLELNAISVCTLAISRALTFDIFTQSKELGSFILIDRYSNATVAAGIIRHNLRRAQNVHKQALTVTRQDREQLNGHVGRVIWLTGLSGSGKSTLANALSIDLHAQGRHTYILDGDNVRMGLNKDLGFTDADRVENIRRVAEVAKLMMDAGLIVITAFISPFKQEREMAKELIGEDSFIEIFVNTPLETCEERDPKGLYKKSRAGLLPNLSGVGSRYEPPEHADVELDGRDTVSVNLAKIKKIMND